MKDTKLLPMNLQLFASNDDGDQDPNNVPGEDLENKDTDTDKKSEEKTFKQEDVNNIVARESKKATEKLLKELGVEDFENAKDGLVKFREWQENQKTEQEKQEEALEELKKSKTSLSNENESLKAQLAALKQGVVNEAIEDVVALAERLVKEDTNIDEAIKQVLDKYPHFAGELEEDEEDIKPRFTRKPSNVKDDSNKDPFLAKIAKYN